MKRFQRLEAIRGFTALLVLVHHIVLFVPGAGDKLSCFQHPIITNYGRIPVLIFFILSGIVIQYSFNKSKDKTFKTYLFKRSTRIYIPLFALWAITPFIQYYQQGYLEGYGIATFLGNIFMLQDLGGYDYGAFPPLFNNYSLWSLSYEWWYYMFFFFITYKVTNVKHINYFIYPLILFGYVLSAYFSYVFIRWIDLFIFWWIGREIAMLYINNKEVNIPNLWKPISLLLLGIPIHYYKYTLGVFLEDAQAQIFFIMFLIIMTGLIWHKMGWPLFNYVLGPFKRLAPISYGLYITHLTLVVYARYLDFIDNWYLRYALYITICFTFSYLVERIVYPRVTQYLQVKLLKSNI